MEQAPREVMEHSDTDASQFFLPIKVINFSKATHLGILICWGNSLIFIKMACDFADQKLKLLALDTLFKLVVYGFLRGQSPADSRAYPRKDSAVSPGSEQQPVKKHTL